MNEDFAEGQQESLNLDLPGGVNPGRSESDTAIPVGQADRNGPARVNLLDCWQESASAAAVELETVRLTGSELPLVPFVSDATLVKLHYCEEPEIKGYVHCNGPGCVLCRAGREVAERFLLPVYLPTTGAVAVLPMSPSIQPGALRPLIMPALLSKRRVALVISKPDRFKHRVKVVALDPSHDDGAGAIAGFLARWESGGIDLGSIYQRLADSDLAEIPAIATILKYKGGAGGA
jgi:hypothetical protein